jgi:hypothetical protein
MKLSIPQKKHKQCCSKIDKSLHAFIAAGMDRFKISHSPLNGGLGLAE